MVLDRQRQYKSQIRQSDQSSAFTLKALLVAMVHSLYFMETSLSKIRIKASALLLWIIEEVRASPVSCSSD